MREGEVRSREGGAPAVDPVEDVHDLLNGEIVPGHLIDRVGVVADLVEAAEAGKVLLNEGAPFLVEGFEPFQQPGQPFAQELVDLDPGRVVLHAQLLPESELLGLDVEVEVEEQGLPFVESRCLPPEQDVESRQALLPIEQQQRVPVRRRLGAANQGRFVGAPDQQVSGGVLPIERLHQPPHLVSIPDIAALKLGEQDFTAADLAQQVLN